MRVSEIVGVENRRKKYSMEQSRRREEGVESKEDAVVSMYLAENDAVLAAAHENQNAGRVGDSLMYLKRLHANLALLTLVSSAEAPNPK